MGTTRTVRSIRTTRGRVAAGLAAGVVAALAEHGTVVGCRRRTAGRPRRTTARRPRAAQGRRHDRVGGSRGLGRRGGEPGRHRRPGGRGQRHGRRDRDRGRARRDRAVLHGHRRWRLLRPPRRRRAARSRPSTAARPRRRRYTETILHRPGDRHADGRSAHGRELRPVRRRAGHPGDVGARRGALGHRAPRHAAQAGANGSPGNGFVVDQTFHDQTRRQRGALRARSPRRPGSSCPAARPPAVGSVFRNPDMARAYRELRTHGVDSLYDGPARRGRRRRVTRPEHRARRRGARRAS